MELTLRCCAKLGFAYLRLSLRYQYCWGADFRRSGDQGRPTSPAVIIVAITAIASFIVPALTWEFWPIATVFIHYAWGNDYLRYPAGASYAANSPLLVALVRHPYFVPIGPMGGQRWRDVFIRIRCMLKRPYLVGTRDQTESPGQMPRPESQDEGDDHEDN